MRWEGLGGAKTTYSYKVQLIGGREKEENSLNGRYSAHTHMLTSRKWILNLPKLNITKNCSCAVWQCIFDVILFKTHIKNLSRNRFCTVLLFLCKMRPNIEPVSKHWFCVQKLGFSTVCCKVILYENAF